MIPQSPFSSVVFTIGTFSHHSLLSLACFNSSCVSIAAVRSAAGPGSRREREDRCDYQRRKKTRNDGTVIPLKAVIRRVPAPDFRLGNG
jgi:hypothetical protein